MSEYVVLERGDKGGFTCTRARAYAHVRNKLEGRYIDYIDYRSY